MSLLDMWVRQAKQQRNWYDTEALPPEDRNRILNQLILDIHGDVVKLQRLVDLDRYHILKRNESPNQEDVAEAGVDIFKLVMAVLQMHGVGANLFDSVFHSKSDVVDDKWKREQNALREDEEVLMVDLDGCVADWVPGFMEFCASKGKPIVKSQINEAWLEPLKDEYHRTGGFIGLRPVMGAKLALDGFRLLGIKIVIVTARPYHQFKRVYADTIVWCRREGIHFDNIIFKRDKAEAVHALAPARIIGFVEDRAKHALEVALTGVTVYKLPSYGGEKVEHPNIIPVSGWAAISQAVGYNRSLK